MAARVLGAVPVRLTRGGLLDGGHLRQGGQRDHVEVGRGRGGREAPAGRRQPGDLLESGLPRQREHATGHDDLENHRHDQQRHRLLGGIDRCGDQQAEGHRDDRQHADGHDQLHQRLRQECPVRRQRAADQPDGDHHHRLHSADQAQDYQLGDDVRAGRQPGRAFPAVDGPFLDQLPYRIGGSSKAGADHEDQQQRLGALVVGANQAQRGRQHPYHHAEDHRHRGQEGKEYPVGGDDRHEPPAQGAQLREAVTRRGRCRGRLHRPADRGSLAVHLRCHVAVVVSRVPVLSGPVPVRLGVEGLEHLSPAGLAEVLEPVGRRAEVGDLAAGHQDEQAVAQVQVGDAMRDHDDRAAVVGQVGHHLHDGLVQPGIQAGRGLVQEQQRGLGQQLKRDVDAFLLAAGERGGPGIGVCCQG